MTALEKHYSVKQIAELWNLSPAAIRAIFRDRTDVLRIGREERMHKRAYITLRIPESVVEKVHAELRQNKGAR